MEPLRLIIEDFMNHRYSDIDCTSFSTALIIGRTTASQFESNGVGKTSIFHAIDYVLFGQYPTKTVDKIVRYGSDKCRVTLEFLASAGKFKITRSRNKKTSKSDLKLEEWRVDKWESITQKTPTETENELTKNILKIGYTAFKNSVLFAQSDLRGLASVNPADRKTILKEALNLADYSKLEKIAKQDLTDCSKNITSVKAVADSLGKPEQDISAFKIKLQELQLSLTNKTEEHAKAQAILIQNKSELSDLDKVISSEASVIHEKLAEVKSQKSEIVLEIATIKKSIKEKELQLSDKNKSLEIKKKELSSLQEQKTFFSNKTVRNQEVIKTDINSMGENEANGRARLSRLEDDCVALKRPLPKEESCPHCRQVLTHEHRIKCIEELAQRLESTELEIVKIRKKLELVKNKKKELEAELKEASLLEVSLISIQEKINNKSTEIEHLEEVIQHLNDSISKVKNNLEIKESVLAELTQRELSLHDSSKEFATEEINKKIQTLKTKILNLEKETKNTWADISSINTHIGIFSEKLKKREEELINLQELNNQLAEFEKDQQIKTMVVQGFSASGIPSLIIHTVLDDLQIEANKFLSELRPGLELQFLIAKDNSSGESEETLDIIYRLRGVELDYEQLSGGQKFMIAFSLKLGLSLVIQHRLGVNLKFLELDEVDQSLDRARVDAFAEIIRKLQDRFKIFAITHNDWLKDKFSHVISVEEDGNNGATAKVLIS